MSEEPEHRMLFDLRGRRKRVIQVIYVILAFLMAASLLVIGMPGGMGMFGSGGSVVSKDAAKLAKERAANLEQKLTVTPNKDNLRIQLVRERITAGNSLVEVDENGAQTIGDEARAQYNLAADAWSKYLKKTDRPDPAVAQMMANTFFTMSEGSTVAQFKSSIDGAVEAQTIYAENAVREANKGGQNPSGPLTSLAMYQMYAQDFETAEATRRQAIESAAGDAERKQIRQQLNLTEKDARRIGKILKQAEKQARQQGSSALDNPLGGLGAGASASP